MIITNSLDFAGLASADSPPWKGERPRPMPAENRIDGIKHAL